MQYIQSLPEHEIDPKGSSVLWLDRLFGTLLWQAARPARLRAPDAVYDTVRPLSDTACAC